MDEAETEASAAAAETSASFIFITAENIPVRHRDSVRAETVHRLITEETVNKNYRPVEPAADLGVSMVYDKTLVCVLCQVCGGKTKTSKHQWTQTFLEFLYLDPDPDPLKCEITENSIHSTSKLPHGRRGCITSSSHPRRIGPTLCQTAPPEERVSHSSLLGHVGKSAQLTLSQSGTQRLRPPRCLISYIISRTAGRG